DCEFRGTIGGDRSGAEADGGDAAQRLANAAAPELLPRRAGAAPQAAPLPGNGAGTERDVAGEDRERPDLQGKRSGEDAGRADDHRGDAREGERLRRSLPHARRESVIEMELLPTPLESVAQRLHDIIGTVSELHEVAQAAQEVH